MTDLDLKKRSSGLLNVVLGVSLSLSVAACAPKQTDRVYPEPKLDFGPLQKDADLALEKDKVVQVTAAQFQFADSQDAIDSARVFRFGEALTTLGQTFSNPVVIAAGDRVGRAFYRARGTTTKNAFKDSLYISAAIGETKEDVLPIIKENDEMLAAQLPLIHKALQSASQAVTWPGASGSPSGSPSGALKVAKEFAVNFLEIAGGIGLNQDVLQGIRDTFKKDFFPLLNGLSSEVDSILAEKRSVIMLRRLREIAKKYEVDFGPATTAMLDQAEGIMVDIEGIQGKHDALTVIVELWEMTDAENREKTFRPVSEDLFKYLNGKSASDLRCVKNPGCLTPWIFLPKKIGLLPAIEKYGLEKLKVDISVAAHDSLIKTLNEEVSKFVPQIPNEIESKVGDQIGVIRKKLASVRDDYTGFIRGIAQEYEKQSLKERGEQDEVVVAGLETRRVKVAFGAQGMQVAADLGGDLESAKSGVTTGAEAIGSSMAYMSSLWSARPDNSFTFKKSVLTQVNKMLSLGGYRTPSGKPFPSISLSLDRHKSVKHLNVADDLSSKATFAVPDSFAVSNNLIPSAAEAGVKSVSVRAQAELLRGLSGMVRYFRDWEKNGFDESMGAVEIGSLIKDLPAGGVKQKLFPKETFFALAVANGAAILQNLTKDLSPVFLIDIDRNAAWANERSDDTGSPATMAGIVDIVKGERASSVSAPDAARFLLAISDFISATEGIEKTQASPLITPGADGQKPVDMIVAARADLSLLIVGLGNFISHEMQGADGGIYPSYSRQQLKASASAPRTAGDQAVCILALLKAGEVIGKKIYEWPALDAYAFMNRKLFNHATGFYSASETSKELPAADDLANILLAGEALKTRMSEKSRDQWTKIAAPWMKALESL